MKIGDTKALSAIVLLLTLCFGSTPVAASSLDFVLSDQTVWAGDRITVDVLFSDPEDSIVGTFDLFVNYDPYILTFDYLTFGPGLGGRGDSLQFVEEPQAGSINAAQLSLLGDLAPLQDGRSDLLLFSMIFNAEYPGGTSPLSFSSGIDPDFDFLGDASGNAIALESIGTAGINVVPIPSSLWLMSLGAMGLLGFLCAAPRRDRIDEMQGDRRL